MSLKTLPALNDTCLQADLTATTDYAIFKEDHFHDKPWDDWYYLVKDLPKCHPTKGPWIAGGSVRRMLLHENIIPEGDIDYFCCDKQQFDILCSRLESRDAVLKQETKDHKTYTCVIPTQDKPVLVQCVRSRFKDSLEKHMNEFDFALCQTGWDGEKFLVSVQAWKDLQTKTISLTGKYHSPIGSWIRIAKYYDQGFVASHDTLLNLLDVAKDTKLAVYSKNSIF